MSSTPLFPDLPASPSDTKEEAAPSPPPSGKPRLREPDRRSVRLMAVDLDSLIPGDHAGRAVWAYVLRLDLHVLEDAVAARGSHPGRPATGPRLLLVRDAGGCRKRPGAGTAVRQPPGLPLAVWWRVGQPPHARGVPRGPRRAARPTADPVDIGAVGVGYGRSGPGGPGWHAGSSQCRRGFPPSAQDHREVQAAGHRTGPATEGGAGVGLERHASPPGSRPAAGRRRARPASVASLVGAGEGRGEAEGPQAAQGEGQERARSDGPARGDSGRPGRGQRAGVDHRPGGPGDEDGGRRLPPGLQRPAVQRHEGAGGGRCRGHQRRLRPASPRPDGRTGRAPSWRSYTSPRWKPSANRGWPSGLRCPAREAAIGTHTSRSTRTRRTSRPGASEWEPTRPRPPTSCEPPPPSASTLRCAVADSNSSSSEVCEK